MSVKLVVDNKPKPVAKLPAELVMQLWLDQFAWWVLFWQGKKQAAYITVVPR